jgi:PAS domain S-box-containing protein
MSQNRERSDIEFEHYRVLFEFAPDAILVVDASGTILMNNAQAEILLKAAAGELVGMSVEKLVPLSARKHHAALRTGFVRTTHSRPMGVGLSLHAVRLDGHEFPVEISLSSTRSASVNETIVVMRDVTERLAARRTETELLRSKTLTKITQIALRERDLQVLCDQLVELLLPPLSADLVSIIDRSVVEGRFVLRSAFGQSADEVRGTKFDIKELPPGRDVPILVGDLNENKSNIFPSASTRSVRAFISAPLISNEVALGVINVASNSPHKFGIEDLAFLEAVANIVATAFQRAAVEEKLVKSQRLESLGQLTGGVAHDFNNLLTVISGNLQLIEESLTVSAGAVKPIAAAQRASRRGAELTAKLLAFARRQTLRPEAIDIQKLLIEFQELLARTLGTNISISVRCASGMPYALVDGGALEDALLNLAVNGRDAMPSGGTLKLVAEAADIASTDAMVVAGEVASGHYIRLSVTDSGIGMSPETMPRVFEPFFTTKAVGKGSGLGLSMVYGFAKQSAGHVTLESQPDIGTTVSLYLPIAGNNQASLESTVVTRLKVGNNEKILVIEDDDDVRDIAIAFLDSLGYQPIEASTIANAVTQLNEHPDIVLVFSDVMLAGTETGPEACKELLELKPALHLLYASGYAKRALPVQLGIDDRVEFLKKPYSRDELADALKRAMLRDTPQ